MGRSPKNFVPKAVRNSATSILPFNIRTFIWFTLAVVICVQLYNEFFNQSPSYPFTPQANDTKPPNDPTFMLTSSTSKLNPTSDSISTSTPTSTSTSDSDSTSSPVSSSASSSSKESLPVNDQLPTHSSNTKEQEQQQKQQAFMVESATVSSSFVDQPEKSVSALEAVVISENSKGPSYKERSLSELRALSDQLLKKSLGTDATAASPGSSSSSSSSTSNPSEDNDERQRGDNLGEDEDSSETVSESGTKKSKFDGIPLGVRKGENVTRLSFMVYRLIKKYKIVSMVDISCTETIDWMPQLLQFLQYEIPGFDYHCVVLFPFLEKQVSEKFQAVDTVADVLVGNPWVIDLPEVDFALTWNLIQRLEPVSSWGIFKKMRKAKVEYVALNNNPGYTNIYNTIGQTEDINVRRPPFHFGEPMRVVNEIEASDDLPAKQLIFYNCKKIREALK